jgi:hypothetical protein
VPAARCVAVPAQREVCASADGFSRATFPALGSPDAHSSVAHAQRTPAGSAKPVQAAHLALSARLL